MTNKFLKNESKLVALGFGEKEGEKIINISPKSTTELGRLLSPLTPSFTRLFCGKVACIKTFMEAIRTPGFPTNFLGKAHLSSEEVLSIPKKKVILPNYWALVAYAVVERIRQDKKLMGLLKTNTLTLTSLNKDKVTEFFGKKITCSVVHNKMAMYVAIVRHIELMIKSDEFMDKAKTDEFILKCRDDETKDIMEGMCLTVTESN